MTVEDATAVLALLAEDPLLRVYQYQHARTGRQLYALFPPWQADDMAWAPEVATAVLLSADGVWTPAGAQWQASHRPWQGER